MENATTAAAPPCIYYWPAESNNSNFVGDDDHFNYGGHVDSNVDSGSGGSILREKTIAMFIVAAVGLNLFLVILLIMRMIVHRPGPIERWWNQLQQQQQQQDEEHGVDDPLRLEEQHQQDARDFFFGALLGTPYLSSTPSQQRIRDLARRQFVRKNMSSRMFVSSRPPSCCSKLAIENGSDDRDDDNERPRRCSCATATTCTCKSSDKLEESDDGYNSSCSIKGCSSDTDESTDCDDVDVDVDVDADNDNNGSGDTAPGIDDDVVADVEDLRSCCCCDCKNDDNDDDDESDDESLEECAICLAKFEEGEAVCDSSNHACRHVFHVECMTSWLLRNDSCPVCRQPYLHMCEVDEEAVGGSSSTPV